MPRAQLIPTACFPVENTRRTYVSPGSLLDGELQLTFGPLVTRSRRSSARGWSRSARSTLRPSRRTENVRSGPLTLKTSTQVRRASHDTPPRIVAHPYANYIYRFTATLPHLKYVNMAAHMAKMDAIRSGGTYDEFGSSSYDPNADMAAHSNALRRPVVETETYLSQAQLAELRRVQNERIEMGKRKTLGLEVKRDLGVRMDGSSESARPASSIVAKR